MPHHAHPATARRLKFNVVAARLQRDKVTGARKNLCWFSMLRPPVQGNIAAGASLFRA
jgi:hypothetical protein